jgi:predicted metalloendopeptidase
MLIKLFGRALGIVGFVFWASLAIGEDNTRITPRQDFNLWVNHNWMESTPIPADKPGINNFLLIQEDVNNHLLKLLATLKDKTAKSVSEKKIALLYDAYLNTAKRDVDGLSSLQADLQQIEAVQNYDDVVIQFARLQKLGVAAPLFYVVGADFKQSSRNIVIVSQAGLGLERDNLLGDDERSKNIRQHYLEALQKLFLRANINQPAQQANFVLALEIALAQIQWSNTENRNPEKTYNLTDYTTLNGQFSNLAVEKQLAELGVATSYPFNVMQPDYVQAFNSFLTTQKLPVWKAYLKARLLMSYAPLLDSQTRSIMVEYEIKLGQYDQDEPIPQQAVRYLNKNVGMLLGKTYIENSFDERIKPQLKEIIQNIVEEYHAAITASPRMEASTKAKAIDKLNKMTFKIGYPDVWQDYSALELVPGNLAENQKRISLYEHKRNITNLHKPVDKNEWDRPPQDVNAFYNPTTNSFVLLAGILHPPFYDVNGTDAEHYGGIGFVIGHEIGHGFDDQGSQFDGDGNLVKWWSQDDLTKFNAIKSALINQANQYEILPGKFLKGELEIGEIIGDLSGAEISLRAYQKIIRAKKLDPQQAYRDYFKQIATTWRDKMRDDMKLLLIDADPHPASEFRANGIVKNFDEFHDVFKTQPGDAMYMPPDQRVRMW